MTIPLPSRSFAFIAAAVTVTAGFSEVQAQTYFFDFGNGNGTYATSFDDEGNTWNTVPNEISRSNDQVFDAEILEHHEVPRLRIDRADAGGVGIVELEVRSAHSAHDGGGIDETFDAIHECSSGSRQRRPNRRATGRWLAPGRWP